MANLKNITDLPIAESAEGLNLIVNDNGSAKQIAASAVGAQADWDIEDASNSAYIKNKPDLSKIGVQSDFSQNDETAIDYIKNRTHYSESTSFSMEVQTANIEIINNWGDISQYEGAYLGTVNEIMNNDDINTLNFVKIIYDGVEYTDIQSRSIGKGSLTVWEFYEEGDYIPYLLQTTRNEDNGEEHIYLITPEDSGEHSIKIVTQETVHKLDIKYIPEAVAADMVISQLIEYDETYISVMRGSYESIQKKARNLETVKIVLITEVSGTGSPYYIQHSTCVKGNYDSNAIYATFIDFLNSTTMQIRTATIYSDKVTISTSEFTMAE